MKKIETYKPKIEIADSLMQSEKNIILASNAPKIKSHEDSNLLVKKLQLMIEQVFFLTNHKKDFTAESELFLVRKLAMELITYFPNMTIEEIELAFDKGVKKEFGEFYGISFMTLYEWIKEFNLLKQKTALKNKQLLADEVNRQLAKMQMPKEEQWRLSFEWLEKWVEEKKSLPSGWSWADCFYYLESHGLINDTIEQKKILAAGLRVSLQKQADSLGRDFKKLQQSELLKSICDADSFKNLCRKERVCNYFCLKYNLL